MRRRHLLALVILALVVATVVITGPVRVWDWMTLRTVEEYWPTGQVRLRLRLRFWESNSGDAYPKDHTRWYANGQKESELRGDFRDGRLRGWSDTGQLLTQVVAGTGVISVRDADGEVSEQRWLKNHRAVATRTSPPWFTEAEILQSQNGFSEGSIFWIDLPWFTKEEILQSIERVEE